MKKYNLKETNTWFVATIMAFILLFIGGCQLEEFIQMEDEVYENEKRDEIPTRSLSYQTWSQQLNCLVNEIPEVSFITSQGLHLIDYKLLDYVVDKNAPLNENTLMPLYNTPEDVNTFVILPLLKIKKVDPGTGSRYENGLKKILLDEYHHSELKNVLLTWQYKDQSFTTICFVTDKEVIYDDILSNIRQIILSESRIVGAIEKSNIPRLKRESENESSPPDGCIPASYAVTSKRAEISSWSGGLMAYAYCEFSISGCVDGNNKYLQSADYNSEAWTKNGYYYAAAATELISIQTGLNGVAHFKYACAVGSEPINIEWDGFSFNIVGGASTSYSGGEVIPASKL